MLIDAGMDSSGTDVQALLAAMHADIRSVCTLMITHWHNDHAAGARFTQSASNCEVLYDEAEKPWLTREKAQGGLRGWIAERVPEWGIGVLLIGLLGEAVPNAVNASSYVSDGEIVGEEFEVISTPGHTAGHTSFYYRPDKVLFAGDALAAINNRVRFMARPVTEDLDDARRSMEKCLSYDIGLLCPGHRTPIIHDVERACDQMREHLASGGKWPFFG